jgi:hypothetical protein
MFKVPFFHRSSIVSDKGFTVTVVSRSELRYEENQKVMTISIEQGDRHIDVFHSTIRKWDGDEAAITNAEDYRITQNILQALKWRGWTAEVVT